MTTSGTWAWSSQLEGVDLIQESFERCGIEFSQVAGNQMDSARRSLQMLWSEFSNKGPNLWTVTLQSNALTSGVASVTLPVQTIEVLQCYVTDTSVTPNIDYILTGISRADYDALPYKTQSGHRPTQFYLDRQTQPIIYLWPVQDNNSIILRTHSWLFQQDVGNLTNQLDVPSRWLDAVAAKLAYRLAVKWAPQRMADLKQAADEAFAAAAAEDVESVPMRIAPDLLGSRWA